MVNEHIKYPERKTVRAKFNDYSGGKYFITICTDEKAHFFGKIVGAHGSCAHSLHYDNFMQFTPLGKYCQEQLENIHEHYPYAIVPLYVVMPNHIHAIIIIEDDGRTNRAPLQLPTLRTALSVVVGGFKRSVTMYARRNNIDFDWQRGYHDHIIRGYDDGNKIAHYIENNVALWGTDCFNDK